MDMSKVERLMLMMICDLYKPPEEREFDAEFVSKAIAYGHLWALDWEYDNIVTDFQYSREDVKETVDILNMWRVVEVEFGRLSSEEKERVSSAVETPAEYIRFRGFDGNNEDHCAIARFMVREMGRWPEFKGRELNSHYPSVPGYRRMLHVYKQLTSGSIGRVKLTVDQLIQILQV